jgi:hypothetical protein
MRANLATLSIVLGASMLYGCAARQKPLAAPPVSLERSIYSGSVLSGPTTRPVELRNPNEALIASIRLIALDQVPLILSPIAPDVRLIITTQGKSAIQPTGKLTRDLRWASGEEVTPPPKVRATTFSDDAIAIPPAASASVNVTDQHDSAKAFRILLNQSKSGDLTLAVGVSDELAVMKPIQVKDATPVAVLIPVAFSKSEAKSVLAQMEIRRATSDPQDAKLVAEANATIAHSLALASSTQPTAASENQMAYDIALRGLDDPRTRRESLVFATRQMHADICHDMALVATDGDLANLCAAIQTKASDPNAPRDDASASWMLDSAALKYAGDLQSKDQCPPELLALLIRYTGQVGMNSGSVSELMQTIKSRKDFDARVVAENLIYLEDSSPAARVRARDWLASRGKAPPGYDPLGPPRAREAALEKFDDSMSKQAAANGGK